MKTAMKDFADVNTQLLEAAKKFVLWADSCNFTKGPDGAIVAPLKAAIDKAEGCQ
jgi:hypothetical protein